MTDSREPSDIPFPDEEPTAREPGSDDDEPIPEGGAPHLSFDHLPGEEPPLASGGFGYDPGISQNLLAGRTWTLDLTRSF